MHIDGSRIADFRNLKDFETAFGRSAKTADGIDRDLKSHAVIGRNGTGKSNLIEAIIAIFRDLDLNNAASFGYEMDYGIRNHRVRIVAVGEKSPKSRSTARAFPPRNLPNTPGSICRHMCSSIIPEKTSASNSFSRRIKKDSPKPCAVAGTI